MKNNEWGVKPGSQENLSPEAAPMLSESERGLINLYRALPEPSQRLAFRALFEFVSQVHDADSVK